MRAHNTSSPHHDDILRRINNGEILVMPLRGMNQIDPERCAAFTMSHVTRDGHDYHVHEDTSDRSYAVIDAHDFHCIGTAHLSPCGEYWLVQIEDDDAAPFGSGWSMHANSTDPQELARAIIAAVTF